MRENKGHILIVDDDRGVRTLLSGYLESEGYLVSTCSGGVEALDCLREGGSKSHMEYPDVMVDLVLSDVRMDQMDGVELLKTLKIEIPETPVILMTAFASVDVAIEAMRMGAFHYVVKPIKLPELGLLIERALDSRDLRRDVTALRHEVKRAWSMGDIIGKSPAMRSIYDLVARVSQVTANILITGESGVGKEMVARAIHAQGPRQNGPFVAINCTAIPETLLESELFGHAKGSFTGAIAAKRGLVEEANGGTLFLDEIGDMSPPLQSKLLRVIQERKVRRVGENTFYDMDVRIIAATHKDLKTAIREERFREDLYYRLSVIPIAIPPLRDRPEDIPLLAEHFLRKYAATGPSKVRGFTKRAMAKLVHLRWEGNVRELENVIERTVVLSKGGVIDESDIPDSESTSPENFYRTATGDFPTLDQFEERYIRMILEKTGGQKDKAAQILGINRKTLYRKERQYGWAASKGIMSLSEELAEEEPLRSAIV